MKLVQYGFVILARTAMNLPDDEAAEIEKEAPERIKEFAERMKEQIGFDELSVLDGILMVDGDICCIVRGDCPEVTEHA